ncbi:MAG: hypothetical protein NTX01_04335, partial [Candidatus Omnitrophica bacterium]|nr:hypothetical protein [Candidatus Omnitrophota bacterium]
AGLLTKITHENADNINYTYDAANQLKTEVKKNSAGTILYAYTYTYDAVKNRLSMLKDGVTTAYTYNTLNQLTQAGSTSYTYDFNGNQIKSTISASTTTYTYDLENRLTKIAYPGATPASTFTYDADGRKVKSTEGAILTNYLFDGQLPILERNSSNLTQVTYTRALGAPGGIGGMISQARAGVTTWFHNIHNGPTNVSHLTNSTGAVVQKYAFDAFGNITTQAGSTTNNYRFQTKELHPQSGLVYFGSRWYNPTIGRWMSPDPLGMVDGPNVYCYLSNNPINDIDPWGLCAEGGGGFFGKVGDWLWNNVVTPVYNTLSNIGIGIKNTANSITATVHSSIFGKSTAPFAWFDLTSLLFSETNYCGITKSGPGPELSSLDQACHRHDDCIQQTHDDFWNLANPEIRECHNDFICGN